MMNGWLLSLSNDDICLGLAAAHDRTMQADLARQGSPLAALYHDGDLFNQAVHLAQNGFDRALAVLTWHGDQHE